jgi:hypothetical protein
MMTILPVVKRRKYFKSSGKYHGSLLSMPIQLFSAIATIKDSFIVIPKLTLTLTLSLGERGLSPLSLRERAGVRAEGD